jgi:hypothetical protein
VKFPEERAWLFEKPTQGHISLKILENTKEKPEDAIVPGTQL